MAAGRIVLPGWMPALDSNGDPIPNAQIYIYLNGTTTLATVYSDETLTTPIANPVEANSSGQFPEIWADDANLFSVSVDAPYGPPGIPFTFDSIGPATASAVIEVATEAAQAVVSTKTDRTGDTFTGPLGVFANTQVVPALSAGLLVTTNFSNGQEESVFWNRGDNGGHKAKDFAHVFKQIKADGTAVDLVRINRRGGIAAGGFGWMEALASQSETVAQISSLSRDGGGIAVLGASRASDCVAPAYFSNIGLYGVGYNDRQRTGDFNTTFATWGVYGEAWRTNGSGRAHSAEFATINLLTNVGDVCRNVDPFNYGQPNQITGPWISSGRPDQGANQSDSSLAIGVIANPTKFDRGLMFADGSLAMTGGVADAYMQPVGYQMSWWTSGGRKGFVRSDQTNASGVVGMAFADDRVNFYFGATTNVFMVYNGVRNYANGGFTDSETFIGNGSPASQWRLTTSAGGLYLDINVGSTAAPSWSNRGRFDPTSGKYVPLIP